MKEKYRKIYAAAENQYAKNSPVMIKAASLVHSVSSNSAYILFNIENISPKTISSIALSYQEMDRDKNAIANKKECKFEDLDFTSGSVMGPEHLISCSGDARSFSFSFNKIIFADGETWTLDEDASWKPFEMEASYINNYYKNPRVTEQLKSDISAIGGNPVMMPADIDGLWLCSCGALNSAYDDSCRFCHVNKEKLFAACSSSNLTASFNRTLAAERKAEEEALEAKNKKKKKARKITILSVIALAFIALMIFLIIPFIRYKVADSKVKKGQYQEAIAIYEDLGEYFSSKMRTQYAQALQNISNAQCEEGIKKLLSNGIPVDVNYATDGGKFVSTGVGENNHYTSVDEFYGLEKLEKDYYDFHGWNLEGVQFDPAKHDIAVLDFAADFTPTEYKITYISDGTITPNNPETYNYESDAITLKTPTREGYTFIAWFDEEGNDITGKVVIPKQSHGEYSFTATWEAGRR